MDKLILERAQSAALARDFTLAARLYKTLLREEPNDISLYKALGNIYVKNGEDDKALQYFENVLSFDKDDADAMNSMGCIYRRLKKYEKSTEILQRALETGNKNCDVNYSLGFTYKEMGNFDDAIDCFESVVAERPSDVLAYNHLGAIYAAKKDYQKAVQSYRRGLQSDPNHPILHFNLAHTYESQKNYPEAIKEYELSLKAKPGWIEAIQDYVKLLIKCSKTRTAFDRVQKSIELYPSNAELNSLMGNVYLRQFDYDNAVESYKKADRLKADDGKILIGLAESLEKADKIQMAADYAKRAHELMPDDKFVGKKYAHIMLSAERYDEAFEDINKIYNTVDGKNEPRVLDALAQYYICTGDEYQAQVMFDQIHALNPGYQHHILEAARRYFQRGDTEKAAEYVNRYNDGKIPLNPAAYNLLGRIEEAKGDDQKAMEAFKKGSESGAVNVQGKKETQRIKTKIENNQRFSDLQNDSFAKAEAEKLAAEEAAQNITEDKPEEEIVYTDENEKLINNSDDFDFDSMGDDLPADEEIVENPDAEEDEVSETGVPLLAELGEDEGLSPFDEIENDTDEVLEDEKPEEEEKEPSPEDFFSDYSFGGDEKTLENSEESVPFDIPDTTATGSGPVGLKNEEVTEPGNNVSDDGYNGMTPDTSVPENSMSAVEGVEDNDTAGSVNSYGGTTPDTEPVETVTSDKNEEFDSLFDAFSDNNEAHENEAPESKDGIYETEGRAPKPAGDAYAENLRDALKSEVERARENNERLEKALGDMEETARRATETTDAIAEDAMLAAMRAEDTIRELEEKTNQMRDDFEKTTEENVEMLRNYTDEKAREAVEQAEVVAAESAKRVVDEELNGTYSDFGSDFSEPDFEDNIAKDPFGDEIIVEENSTAVESESPDDNEESPDNEESAEEERDSSVEEESFGTEPEEEIFFIDYEFPTVENLLEEIEIESSNPFHKDDDSEIKQALTNLAERFEDDKSMENYRQELELFLKLRELAESLPHDEKEKFMSSKTRLLMDYVIARLSGKAGLLETAEKIVGSGDNIRIDLPSGEVLSKKVISDLSSLTDALVDKPLAMALQGCASDVLAKL